MDQDSVPDCHRAERWHSERKLTDGLLLNLIAFSYILKHSHPREERYCLWCLKGTKRDLIVWKQIIQRWDEKLKYWLNVMKNSDQNKSSSERKISIDKKKNILIRSSHCTISKTKINILFPIFQSPIMFLSIPWSTAEFQRVWAFKCGMACCSYCETSGRLMCSFV